MLALGEAQLVGRPRLRDERLGQERLRAQEPHHGRLQRDGVAQRLARRLCDRCKASYQPEVHEMVGLRVGFDPSQHALPTLYRPVGCQACANTGYRGRIALHEVMAVSEEIERLAVARASSAEIQRVAVEQGMLTLRFDGWMKAHLGLTSIDEILRVVA